MNRKDTITAIRKESLDLPCNKLVVILDQFCLESYSRRRLSEVSSKRLQEMLETIRRYIDGNF